MSYCEQELKSARADIKSLTRRLKAEEVRSAGLEAELGEERARRVELLALSKRHGLDVSRPPRHGPPSPPARSEIGVSVVPITGSISVIFPVIWAVKVASTV